MAESSCSTSYTIDQFQFGQSIGEGRFGNVYMAKPLNTKNKKLYAIRLTPLDIMSDQDLDLISQEMKNLSELIHDNIITVFYRGHHKSIGYTVMPLMAAGSCDQILAKYYPTGMPEKAVAIIVKDVASALIYMHFHHYVHRGVKGKHVLISAEGNVYLSSFQYTVKGDLGGRTWTFPVSGLNEMTSNLNWLSPELLAQDSEGYWESSDVYSLGILALELANGVAPYNDVSPSAMLVKKLQERPPTLWDKRCVPSQESVSPPRPGTSTQDSEEDIACAASKKKALKLDKIYAKKEFSREFHEFISLCLEKETTLRPSVSVLIRHPFLHNLTRNPDHSNLLQVLQKVQLKKFRAGEHPPEILTSSDSVHSVWQFESRDKL